MVCRNSRDNEGVTEVTTVADVTTIFIDFELFRARKTFNNVSLYIFAAQKETLTNEYCFKLK